MSWVNMAIAAGQSSSPFMPVEDPVAVAVLSDPQSGTAALRFDVQIAGQTVALRDRDGSPISITLQGRGVYRLPFDLILFGGPIRVRAVDSAGNNVTQTGGLSISLRVRRWS